MRLISPNKVLQALPKQRERAIGLRILMATLGLNQSPDDNTVSPLEEDLRSLLDQLVRSGLVGTRAGRYWRKHVSGAVIGTLRGTRSGHAFLVPEDPEEHRKGDLRISQRNLGEALSEDLVLARLTRVTDRGREGRVEFVIRRNSSSIVGTFFKLKRENLVSPIDERFLHEVSVAASDTLAAKDGDIVVVEITRRPIAGRPPQGRIIEVLGPADKPGIDLEIIIRKHRLPHSFPDAALAEAEQITETSDGEDLANRLDLRDTLTITIDGETARDFDDAVSLEHLGGGRLLLGVHIADVSHYVKEGTPLDEEAYRRGTSVYFPERAIPMLPERLSNDICSLKPRVDRLTMSAMIELNDKGKVLNYRLTPSIINSRRRMTYTSVNDIIGNAEGQTGDAHQDVKEMILEMHRLTLSLIARREERGAIDFDLPEPELLFNDEGQIGGIVRSERNIAHRLIEEFMLLANETVASHLDALNIPLLFRIHEEPNVEKVEEFAEIAASFGHKFSMHGPIPQRGFQRLSREVRGKPEERMLSFLMLRSMQRARYSPHNEGHFGLAMKTYTHFTSPIRRYPDLIVHRILRESLNAGERSDDLGGIDLGAKHSLKRIAAAIIDPVRESEMRSALEMIGEQSSARERAADDAQRELMDWRKADFMSERVGDEFDGIITSVTEFGFYVELTEFFIEGLVHISVLRDDSYEFQERRHRLVGTRTGREFRLGDAILVAVDRVDQTRHLIDFSVA